MIHRWKEELDALRRKERAGGKTAAIERRKSELKRRIRSGSQHETSTQRGSQQQISSAERTQEESPIDRQTGPLRSLPSLADALEQLPLSLEALIQRVSAVQLPPIEVVPAFACGVGCGVAVCTIPRYFKQFAIVDDIPIAYFRTQKRLRGKVVSVTDGDTFRMVGVSTIIAAIMSRYSFAHLCRYTLHRSQPLLLRGS
jgi:hypothetical protein